MLGGATALPFGLLSAWLDAAITNRTFGEVVPVGLGAGLLFGLLFGLTMGFLLKVETASVRYGDNGAFLARLQVAMAQLGYHPASQDGRFFTFRPSFQTGLAAGRIAVQLREGEAVIVGPKMYVRKLLEKVAAD
jgi:hypothetical protein